MPQHFPSTKGILIVARVWSYSPDNKNELHLNECGLKLSLPEGILPSDYKVATQSLWGGDFKFPKGVQLVSGVCSISISPAAGGVDNDTELIKPFTVQLMHCVHITHENQSKYLKFVSAQSHQSPFQFELLTEDVFSIDDSHYGTIQSKKSFSLFAIVTEGSIW